MTVWWMTINRAMGNSYADLKRRQVIAQGWPLLGDLSAVVGDFFPPGEYDREAFEARIRQLAQKPYPEDAVKPPRALRNLYNLLSIEVGDLVVAVESAQGAGPVMGICQAERNAWESYRHDDPYAYDYAHTVGYPVRWVNWQEIKADPPRPPAMIAGVAHMGLEQAPRVEVIWSQYRARQG